ncbi:MAG: response regulator transcription factor [Phormidesmis sp.]
MVLQVHLPSWRVLIVEDDPLVQLGLEQALIAYPQLGVIDVIDDGYLAIEAALALRPDLILMDIGLPGIDGIRVAQQIKPQLPEAKIVMLTSHASQAEVTAAFASGAEAYCIKGGSVDVLMTAIATVAQGGLYLDPKIAQIAIKRLSADAVAHAPSNLHPSIDPAIAADYDLSERELEVLSLLVKGMSNPNIAKQLFISPNTVKAHMRSLMNKLAVNDRVQVAVKALRAGLV